MGEIMQAKEIADFSAFARRLWEHSIRCAVAARLLAHTYTRIRSEEALLAGLVHDLGAFYMLYRGAQYPELRERPDTLRYLILQWHEAIGVSLLKTLGLPPEIAQAAVDHDHLRPVPEAPRTLDDVVYIGNILAGGYPGDPQEKQAEEIKFFHEKYQTLLPDIEAEAREMCAALK